MTINNVLNIFIDIVDIFWWMNSFNDDSLETSYLITLSSYQYRLISSLIRLSCTILIASGFWKIVDWFSTGFSLI